MYYSEYGEDKYLVENCKLPEKGIFVDVGAGSIIGSNSYHFELKGWLCLCVEPDKRQPDLEKRKLVDNSIVGSREEMVEFVFHRLPNLSGLHHAKVKGDLLPMYRLDTILEKHKISNIDILSIDVEGNEIDVLKGFSISKYRPSYIVIEYINQFTKNREKEINDVLTEQGYTAIHKTKSNIIFERQ
jgi:FkbM family methyltransferase